MNLFDSALWSQAHHAMLDDIEEAQMPVVEDNLIRTPRARKNQDYWWVGRPWWETTDSAPHDERS